jgi:hypothetical protein
MGGFVAIGKTRSVFSYKVINKVKNSLMLRLASQSLRKKETLEIQVRLAQHMLDYDYKFYD